MNGNKLNYDLDIIKLAFKQPLPPRAAVVHFNFRAGSTFPVPDCTVPQGHWVNKADN